MYAVLTNLRRLVVLTLFTWIGVGMFTSTVFFAFQFARETVAMKSVLINAAQNVIGYNETEVSKLDTYL